MGGRRTGRRTSCRNDGERDEEIESIFFEEQINGSMGRRRCCEAKDDVERRLRLRGAAGRMTNPSIFPRKIHIPHRGRYVCTELWEESDNTLQYCTSSQRH